MVIVDGLPSESMTSGDAPQPETTTYVYEKPDIAKIIAENSDPLTLNLSGVGVDSENIGIVVDAVKNSTVGKNDGVFLWDFRSGEHGGPNLANFRIILLREESDENRALIDPF